MRVTKECLDLGIAQALDKFAGLYKEVHAPMCPVPKNKMSLFACSAENRPCASSGSDL